MERKVVMDITRKTLIITSIINLLIIAIGVACVVVTKFNTTILWLCVATFILVTISSIIVWRYGKEFKK